MKRLSPETLKALEQALGYRFQDASLLAAALTHRSVLTPQASSTYERLEFLGDRVLGLVVADMLYRRYPKEPEGALARRFTALVRREALARVASAIGLGDHLVLSRGEDDSGGRANPTLLADVCEALIGALYLEGGLETARGFIASHWPPLMEEDMAPPKDARTALQEWAQQRGKPLPVYETLEQSGPDHNPVFTVRVSVKGVPPATATGTSKRVAAKAAAEALLETLV